VSEGTFDRLGGHFELRKLPEEKVKGKAQAIQVFEVLGSRKRD